MRNIIYLAIIATLIFTACKKENMVTSTQTTSPTVDKSKTPSSSVAEITFITA